MAPKQHYNLSRHTSQAVSLSVYRPSLNRWAIVAKLTQVDGDTVLAVPYRHRQRLGGRISLPLAVLRYAAEQGATAIIVRFDAERQAFRLPLAEALRLGRPGSVDGQPEIWLRLDDFIETPWPDWPFATEAVRLGPGPESFPQQLTLLEVAG